MWKTFATQAPSLEKENLLGLLTVVKLLTNQMIYKLYIRIVSATSKFNLQIQLISYSKPTIILLSIKLRLEFSFVSLNFATDSKNLKRFLQPVATFFYPHSILQLDPSRAAKSEQKRQGLSSDFLRTNSFGLQKKIKSSGSSSRRREALDVYLINGTIACGHQTGNWYV